MDKLETSVCYLSSGMYLARLESGSLSGQRMSLSVAPVGSMAVVDFFSSPGMIGNMLQNDEDCLVVRVSGEGRAALLIASTTVKDAKPLVLKIDAISNKAKDVIERRQVEESSSFAPSYEVISLLGHVAWAGDVEKQGGEWLGDPGSNKAIEGFGVNWNKESNDVDIAFSCRVKDIGRTPMSLNGGFVGTKQRSKPVLGLMISLVGAHSDKYKLEAEAVFSGGKAQKVLPGVECQGPTGNEPLVALKVNIVMPVANDLATKNIIDNNKNWTLHAV